MLCPVLYMFQSLLVYKLYCYVYTHTGDMSSGRRTDFWGSAGVSGLDRAGLGELNRYLYVVIYCVLCDIIINYSIHLKNICIIY